MRHAAEAPDKVIRGQRLSKGIAGVQAAPVAVEDGTADWKTPCYGFHCADVEFFPHIVFHTQGKNFSVETVQDERDVGFTIRTLNLGNICQQLMERSVCMEILFKEISHSKGIAIPETFFTLNTQKSRQNGTFGAFSFGFAAYAGLRFYCTPLASSIRQYLPAAPLTSTLRPTHAVVCHLFVLYTHAGICQSCSTPRVGKAKGKNLPYA